MIRPATPSDIPAIAAIINHVIRDTTITVNAQEKTEAEVADMLTARRALGHEMFVADEGGVLGYADNQASIGFHKVLGYDIVARMPQVGHKFGMYHDLVLMQKILT